MRRREALLTLIAAGCAAAFPSAPRTTAFTVDVKGAGRPIVFIPGLGTPGSTWDGVVAHLAGRYESHVLTIAGFAGVPPIEPPLLPKVRAQLAEYVRTRALERPIFVGHSLGGTLALWMAITDPDLVSAVVAVDAALYAIALQDPKQTAATFEPIARGIRDGMAKATPDEFRQRGLEKMKEMVTDPAKAAVVGDQLMRSSQQAFGQAIYELYTLDLRDKAGSIRAPVLTIAAQDLPPAEWPAKEKAWNDMLAPIPRHELVIVPNSKHYIMVDAPDALNRALDAFLPKV